MKATNTLAALLLMPVIAAWASDSGEDLSGPEAYLLLPVFLSMAGMHYAREPFVKRFSKLGWWESSDAAPDGRVRWVGFQQPASVVRMVALVKPGRYRVEGGKLYIAYVNPQGGLAAEEFVPEGAAMASRLQERLQDRNKRHRTYPPIVIGLAASQGERTIQGFRPDGTCWIETNKNSQLGKFEKTKNGIRIRWTYPPQDSGQVEEWTTRRTGSRLFVTHNGVSIEYKRFEL